MSRLTDEELDEALAVAQDMHSLRLTAAVAELRERRSLDAQHMATIDELVRRRNEDLTAEEVEALEWLREWAVPRLDLSSKSDTSCEHCIRGMAALAALSKILRRGKR